jgi:hypothetical protein
MITESTPRAERRLDVSTGAQWAPMDGIAEGKENYEGPLGALLAGRGARCSRVAAIVDMRMDTAEEGGAGTDRGIPPAAQLHWSEIYGDQSQKPRPVEDLARAYAPPTRQV